MRSAADVRSLELCAGVCTPRTRNSGHAGPTTVAGVLATLDAHLEAAHRLRLAQDQWLLNERGMRAYRARRTAPYSGSHRAANPASTTSSCSPAPSRSACGRWHATWNGSDDSCS